MKQVRHAETGDIPAILELLVQVDMVHHNGRPDLFKGPATKYSADPGARLLYPAAFRRPADGGAHHALYR